MRHHSHSVAQLLRRAKATRRSTSGHAATARIAVNPAASDPALIAKAEDMRDEIEARRQVALARRAAALQLAPSQSQLEPRAPGAVTEQGASAEGDGCVAVGTSGRVTAEEESPHGRRGTGTTAVSVTPSTAPRRAHAVALLSCGSRLRGSLISARGAEGGGSGCAQSAGRPAEALRKSSSSASAEGRALDSPSRTPPACASHGAEDAPIRAFDTSACIAVASPSSDRAPDSRAAHPASASELTEHAQLRRELEFAARERRRKTESSYYGSVVHPLEELSAAKQDKNGNPIRENFVKMQHFKRRKFKGRGSKAGGRYGIGGHKLSNGRGFKGKGGRAAKGKGACFLCGKAGHWAQDCPQNGGSGGADSLEAIADELEAPGLAAAEAGSRHSRRGMAAPSGDAVELELTEGSSAEGEHDEEAAGATKRARISLAQRTPRVPAITPRVPATTQRTVPASKHAKMAAAAAKKIAAKKWAAGGHAPPAAAAAAAAAARASAGGAEEPEEPEPPLIVAVGGFECEQLCFGRIVPTTTS